MVRKILGLLLVILCVTVSAENVFAGTNVKTWRNPSLKIDSLKKILVLPVYADLRAGFELQPKNELAKNFEKWAVEGVKSALNNPKKKKRVMVKTLPGICSEMELKYGTRNTTTLTFTTIKVELLVM